MSSRMMSAISLYDLNQSKDVSSDSLSNDISDTSKSGLEENASAHCVYRASLGKAFKCLPGKFW